MIYEEWLDTPNKSDMTTEEEKQIRTEIVKFAKKLGETVQKIHMVVVAKAIHIFHAFTKIVPFKAFNRQLYMGVCILIISKYEKLFANTLEETVKAYLFLLTGASLDQYATFKPDAKTLAATKDKFLIAENEILETIGFDLDIQTPYCHIDQFKKYPGDLKMIFKVALMLINDSYYTTICLYFEPVVIALACIHMAAHYMFKMELPPVDTKPWYKFLRDDIEFSLIEECEKYVKDYLGSVVGSS
jgi:hypothetical protein